MLQSIRKLPLVNSFFRHLFRSMGKTASAGHFLSARWRTSGLINCSFDGLDFKMFNRCDDDLPDVFFYGHDYWEVNDLSFFLKIAPLAKVMVDIGANTGIYSILSHKVNPSAAIFAIEPSLPNFNRLEQNIALNNCSNVKLIRSALGEVSGEVEFTIPEDESITSVSSVNGEFSRALYPGLKWKKVKVPLASLDQLKESHHIATIDLIKCDVETYEINVFKGMNSILTEDRPAILFECFLNDERQQFFNEVLSRYGYYAYGVLNEGLVYLSNGFEQRIGGMNYFLTTVKPQAPFISYKWIVNNPEVVFKTK